MKIRALPLILSLSANGLALGLSNVAIAQDEVEAVPDATLESPPAPVSEQGENPQDAAPVPEDGAAIEAAPTQEERPYESPLNDDPTADGEVGNTNPNVDPPLEGGPAVDENYNVIADSGYGLWKEFHIGPTVQIGFPHPITYGVEAMFAKVLSFGFSTGKYEVTQVKKANIDIKSTDFFVRWHPLAGSFFLGVAYGSQDIDGRFEDDVELTLAGFPRKVPVRVDAEIKSKYYSPRLGWFAVYDSGFTMGFEIGAQIPVSPDTSVNATIPGASAFEEAAVKSTDDYKDLKKQADDAVKILGKRTIPYLTMLKLGWLF